MSARESAVEGLEQALGGSLPEPYRGRILFSELQASGTVVQGDDWYGLERLYGLQELDADVEGVPPGHLAIGEDEGGNRIVLRLADGAIAFCDHDVAEGEDPLTPLAGSFEELLAALRSDEELPELPPVSAHEILVDPTSNLGIELEPRRQPDGSLLVPFGTETRDGREVEVWRAIRPDHPDFAEWSRRLDG